MQQAGRRRPPARPLLCNHRVNPCASASLQREDMQASAPIGRSGWLRQPRLLCHLAALDCGILPALRPAQRMKQQEEAWCVWHSRPVAARWLARLPRVCGRSLHAAWQSPRPARRAGSIAMLPPFVLSFPQFLRSPTLTAAAPTLTAAAPAAARCARQYRTAGIWLRTSADAAGPKASCNACSTLLVTTTAAPPLI